MFSVTVVEDNQTFTFNVKSLTKTTRVLDRGYVENIYDVLEKMKDSKATLTLSQLQRIQKKLLNPVDTQNEYCVVGEDFSVKFEKEISNVL